MTKDQEIDYLLNQIKALNQIGKVNDAKGAFSTLLTYGASTAVLQDAFDSFAEGDLGKSPTELYHNVLKLQEEKSK